MQLGENWTSVVIANDKPLFVVECKTGDRNLSRNIAYFSQRTDIPFYYQVHTGNGDYERAELKARVIPVTRFCELLKL